MSQWNLMHKAKVLAKALIAVFVILAVLVCGVMYILEQGLSEKGMVVADQGFRPEEDGFSFANYGSDEGYHDLTHADLRRMFGEKVYIKNEGGQGILSPAGTYWMESTNEEMGEGHCHGMAELSLLFYNKIKNATDFGANRTFDLKIEDNEQLQREIAYWWATQMLYPARNEYIVEIVGLWLEQMLDPTKRANLITLAAVLEMSLQDDSPAMYTISVMNSSISAGHAVTPFAIEGMGNDTCRILVYDNNYPGETRHIDLDFWNGTWSYIVATRPDKTPMIWSGNASSLDLLLFPLQDSLLTQECPFCEDSEIDVARVTAEGNASLLIVDRFGRRLGNIDGEPVKEIPGSDIIIPMAYLRNRSALEDDSRSPILFMPFAKEEFNVTLNGSLHLNESQSNLTVVAPGYVISVVDITLRPGQKESLWFAPPSIDPEGNLFSYSPSGPESPVIAVGVEEGEDAYLFILKGYEMQNGTSISLKLSKDDGTFLFHPQNTEMNGTYDLFMERINQTGVQVFGHEDVPVGANCTVDLEYKSWPGNGLSMPVILSCGNQTTRLELSDVTDEMPED